MSDLDPCDHCGTSNAACEKRLRRSGGTPCCEECHETATHNATRPKPPPKPPEPHYNVMVLLEREAPSQGIKPGDVVGVILRGGTYAESGPRLGEAMAALAAHIGRYEAVEGEDPPRMALLVYPTTEVLTSEEVSR